MTAHATILSDAEVVARCRRGDEEAWSHLVDRYSRYVWAIASSAYRLSHSEAEEVFQEVFTRAFVHLSRLRRDDAFRPWLGQLTRRLCVDRLRAHRPEVPVERLPEVAASDAAVERLAEALTVWTAVRTLPPHCQEIIERFFARDESYETIAAGLGIAPGTVASRIARCSGSLRKALEQPQGAGTPR